MVTVRALKHLRRALRRWRLHCSSGAPVPATFDFTAGGLIPAANCVQAFDPFAVQDLAQSYVDLSGNGNHAIVTVPPTLGAGGWVFNGTTQYVDTGIIPSATYSVALSFNYLGGAGVYTTFGTAFGFFTFPNLDGNTRMYYDSTYAAVLGVSEGVVIISSYETAPGVRGIYRLNINVGDIGGSAASFTPASTLLLGAMNQDIGAPYRFANCTIARWAMYDIPLFAAQVAALSAGMSVA